jgi:leucyl-tRNA synthetase
MVEQYGADALRVYEMFMGPFDQAISWNTKGLVGTKKFLEKVLNLAAFWEKAGDVGFENDKKIRSLLHKTIKKVSEDIEAFRLNTAVSCLMILVNEITDFLNKNKNQKLPFAVQEFSLLLQILAPFAPHLAEELWERIGNQESIFKSSWPEFDSELIKDEKVNLVIQDNGKLRATLEVAADISEIAAMETAQNNENVAKWLEGKEIVKKIFVPGKLLNIVVK